MTTTSRTVAVELVAKTVDFQRNIRNATGTVNELRDAVGRASDLVSGAFRRIGQAATISGAAMSAGLGLASRSAIEFERNMRNVNSILGEGERGYKRLSDSILDMATKVPQSASTLAEGAYQIVSSGFTSAAESQLILEASAKAASAGLTTVDTAATAITATLNAYSLGAQDAAYVSDVLFQTVNVGVTTFEELAQNLGDFVGIANAAGVSLEEVGAAFAQMTLVQMPAQAATSLSAVIREMVAPTDELTALLQELGYESGLAAIEQVGLQGAMNQVSDAVGGNATALNALFPNIRATTGVLALTAMDAEKAAIQLAKFTDQAQLLGVTEEVLAEQSKSVGFQIDQFKTAFGAAAITIGQIFLPALTLAVGVMTTFVRVFMELPDWLKTGIGLFMGLTAAVLTLAVPLFLLTRYFILVRTAIGFLLRTGLPAWLYKSAAASTFVTTRMAALRTGLVGVGRAAGLLGLVTFGVLELKKALDGARLDKKVDALRDSVLALAEAGTVDLVLGKEFGSDLAKLGDAVNTAFDRSAFDKVKQFGQAIGGFANSDVEVAREKVDALDKAIAALAQASPEKAAEAFERVTEALVAQGIPLGRIKDAFNDTEKAIGEAAYAERVAAGDTAGLTAEIEAQIAALSGASDAADEYASRLDRLRSVAQSFLGIGDITSGIRDAQREAFDRQQQVADATSDASGRTKEIERAYDGIARASERVLEAEEGVTRAVRERENDRKRAQLDKDKAAKRLERLKYISGGNVIAGSDMDFDIRDAELDVAEADQKMISADEKVIDAQRRVRDAHRSVTEAQERLVEATDKTTEATRKQREEYVEAALALGDFAAALEAQIQKYDNFNENLLTLAPEVSPAVIEELQAMGEEGVELAELLAHAAPDEFDKVAGLLEEKVRREGAAYNRQLDIQLMTAYITARDHTKDTVEEIIEELEKLAPGIQAQASEVRAAAETIGQAIKDGIALDFSSLVVEGITRVGQDLQFVAEQLMKETEKRVATRGGGTMRYGDGPGAVPAGGGSGPASAMARDAVAQFGGRVTSGYRTPAHNARIGGSPTSYHLDKMNPAQDIVSPNMALSFGWIFRKYGRNIREMIYGNQQVRGGQLMPYNKNDHWDHVHVAHTGGLITQGGVKPLKRDEIMAKLQVGELVVPKRAVAVDNGASSRVGSMTSSRTYQLGPIYAADLTATLRQAEAKSRLSALVGV